MSAFYYFKKLGYQQMAPIYRQISNAAVATTVTLWTPSAGKRLAVTNVTIGGNAAGTMAFYFTQSANQHEYQIAEYSISASSFIAPQITCWESTAVVAPLGVRFSTGLTNQWRVCVEGFELD